jgi:hypothetical protein
MTRVQHSVTHHFFESFNNLMECRYVLILNFFKVKTCFVKKYNSKNILKTKITSFDLYRINSDLHLIHYQFATTGFSHKNKNFENKFI